MYDTSSYGPIGALVRDALLRYVYLSTRSMFGIDAVLLPNRFDWGQCVRDEPGKRRNAFLRLAPFADADDCSVWRLRLAALALIIS